MRTVAVSKASGRTYYKWLLCSSVANITKKSHKIEVIHKFRKLECITALKISADSNQILVIMLHRARQVDFAPPETEISSRRLNMLKYINPPPCKACCLSLSDNSSSWYPCILVLLCNNLRMSWGRLKSGRLFYFCYIDSSFGIKTLGSIFWTISRSEASHLVPPSFRPCPPCWFSLKFFCANCVPCCF